MPTTFNNIHFPYTTEKVNWGSHFASENLTNLVSDTDKPDISLLANNVISCWELKVIYRSGQRECSWSFPHFIKLEMKMIFLALIVQCWINFTSVQAFVITRASHGRDAFKIPASICKRNGAQSGSDCKLSTRSMVLVIAPVCALQRTRLLLITIGADGRALKTKNWGGI